MNEPLNKSDQPKTKRKPLYTKPKFIASTAAGIIFLILIFQNWEMTTIEIFFWTTTLPRSVFFLIFTLIGFGICWIVRRSKQQIKTTSKGV